MKSAVIVILYKSVKFSLIVVCLTTFVMYMCAATVFGVVLITPSLSAIIFVYGFFSFLVALLYNSLKTYVMGKRQG